MERVLLGQLGANGDCLYATILARQLRQDFPNAEITWAISSQCSGITVNNPYINEIWEIPIYDWDQHAMMWRIFEREAVQRYLQREFDHIVLSQIWPNNFQNYDGTVRSSILRSYGRKISVPIENLIFLSLDEIEHVNNFASVNNLKAYEHRILFECSSKSGQSFVTPDKAQDIADELYKILPDCTVIFSTHLPVVLRDRRSITAGALSLREVAQLTHHISLFIGAGSGGTVAASSSAAALVPMVQLLSAQTSVFASFAHDFEYFEINDRKVLELTIEDPVVIAQCIKTVCTHGIKTATEIYGGGVPLTFTHYFKLLEEFLLKQHRWLDAAKSLTLTAERYGWLPALVEFAHSRIVPNLHFDPRWLFLSNRHEAAIFSEKVSSAGKGTLSASQNLWSQCKGQTSI